MTRPEAREIRIAVNAETTVSGLYVSPREPVACCILAHGAGAGMTHPFMAAVAAGLGDRSIATLRYQFPYMERKSKRPDPPALAQATVVAAVAVASELCSAPLFAGGKSFGGRMTSQAQAAIPLPRVRGLFFLGFPLHPAGKPSVARAEHLSQVHIPMLFLQGTRDELASLELLRPVITKLGARATLKIFEDADHSFHVPARTGRTDAEVRGVLLDALAEWVAGTG